MDDKLEQLVFRYRMLGFDKPVVEYNEYFRCQALSINDPCGQWKLIKGNSSYSCIVGALKWIKVNWNEIQYERRRLINSFSRKMNPNFNERYGY